MTLHLVKPKRAPLYCSFCGKTDVDVGYLVQGPTVFICNECVELCREIGRKLLSENVAIESISPPGIDRLRDALQDLLDYAEEGCPDGGYSAIIEARACLKGFQIVKASVK